MSIDCIDSAGDVDDVFDSDDFYSNTPPTSLWNGRQVKVITEKDLKLEQISQFYASAIQQIDELANSLIRSHDYSLLDVSEEVFEEISENLEQYAEFSCLFAICHPSNRELILADPTRYRADIIECKNILKSAVKKVKKCAKKVVKEVKKGAEEVADFVKEHKKEILIGAAIVAAVAGAYVLSGALSSSAAGLDAVGGPNRKREDEEDSDHVDSDGNSGDPSNRERSNFTPNVLPQQNHENLIHRPASESQIVPNIPPPNRPNFIDPLARFMETLRSGNPTSKTSFDLSYKPDEHPQENLTIRLSPDIEAKLQSTLSSFLETIQNNKITLGLQPLLNLQNKNSQPTAIPSFSPDVAVPLQSAIANLLESIERRDVSPTISAPHKPLLIEPQIEPPPIQSCHVQSKGNRIPGIGIGFINGMNTSLEEHKNHLEHIQKFAGDVCIEGVYNNTHGILGDLGEICLLNYAGLAPNTADLLIENWTQFHQENLHNPDAKYLQFAHSMGTILTKDALQKAPQEIRSRVIVVAFGPAVIIPREICHDSFHYASRKDLVHLGENLYTFVMASFNDETERGELLKQLAKNKDRLILLESDPEDKSLFGHDFQNPTFDGVLKHHNELYLKGN